MNITSLSKFALTVLMISGLATTASAADRPNVVIMQEWRIYPKQFIASAGTPSGYGGGAYRVEGVGFPGVFNIERDPRELWNVLGVEAWVLGEYLRITGEYQASLKHYPNPPGFSMTQFQ